MLGVMVIKNGEAFATNAANFLSSGKLMPVFSCLNFASAHFR